MAKYNHQPFEDWVLERDSLPPEQEQALYEHLQSCPACRQLAESLREVEFRLKAQPLASPQPGFTNRWQSRLAQERARSQKRQTYLFLAVTLGGAVLMILAMAILLLPALNSPYPYLLALTYQFTQFILFVNEVVDLLGSLMQAIFRVIPPLVWIGFSGVTTALIVLWLAVFRLYIYPRRINA